MPGGPGNGGRACRSRNSGTPGPPGRPAPRGGGGNDVATTRAGLHSAGFKGAGIGGTGLTRTGHEAGRLAGVDRSVIAKGRRAAARETFAPASRFSKPLLDQPPEPLKSASCDSLSVTESAVFPTHTHPLPRQRGLPCRSSAVRPFAAVAGNVHARRRTQPQAANGSPNVSATALFVTRPRSMLMAFAKPGSRAAAPASPSRAILST